MSIIPLNTGIKSNLELGTFLFLELINIEKTYNNAIILKNTSIRTSNQDVVF